MRNNVHVQIAAEVAKRLASDPQQSNRSIADALGITEGQVRRQRAVLELAGLLNASAVRVGSDGIARQRMPA